MNVALYGPRKNMWAMTERGRGAVTRDADTLAIGPSAMRWEGDALVVDIAETTAPLPARIEGRVRVIPHGLNTRGFALDGAGRHVWRPIAPSARIEVELDRPASRWKGEAYLDCNFGDEPLEDGFIDWTWSRASQRNGAAILYDAARRDGTVLSMALRFDRSGDCSEEVSPPAATLPASLWRVPRATRADDGAAKLLRTFEDAPFYARSLARSRLFGEECASVHESLLLTRFANPVVKLMLPFRMPRAWR